MSIFDKRVAFKPFEYPEVEQFKFAINHSYWLFSEYNYTSDIHDFHVNLNDIECNVIKNAMLAISQIEVAVKSFWAKLGDRIAKAEFQQVGVTFAESECRHEDAYSNLLTMLDLHGDFDQLLQNPVIHGRVDYLTKYLKGAADNSNENWTLSLTLFSLFIENISLFSQFLVIKSFNKFKNVFKGIDNAIEATAKEENLHALFGAYLVNIIKQENSDWFNEEFYGKIKRASLKAYQAEANIVDWIFEKGDLDFINKDEVKEYIKNRFNTSLNMIGMESVFEVDEFLLSKTIWFDLHLKSKTLTDFFNSRPVNYTRKLKSITSEDLF